jgi:hypothetical protein
MDDGSFAGMFDRFGGKLCSSTNECAFIGRTFFWIICPPSTDCQVTGTLHIKVETAVNPNWNPPDNTPIKNMKSLGVAQKSSSDHLGNEHISMSLMELKNAGLKRCQPGAWMLGLDQRGLPICKCSGMYVEDPNQPSRCIIFDKCKRVRVNGEWVRRMWVGMEAVVEDGKTYLRPKCELMNDFNGSCRTFMTHEGLSKSVEFKCGKRNPYRGFIIKARPTGECVVPPPTKTKDGQSSQVTCPPWEITCCRIPRNEGE